MFVKHLFKYVYQLSPMQITPNDIKWITWFLACCNKSKVQPTFKLFHQLFNLVKSSVKPLYELRFRAAECGFGPGQSKPVMQQSSLKHWNREVILLKGLDLFFLPYISTEGAVFDFKPPVLEGKALKQIYQFCTCLGPQWTRDTFMDHKKMYKNGCKFLCCLLLVRVCVPFPYCSLLVRVFYSSIMFSSLLFSGLPYFNPGQELIMSRNAFAASLRTLGGAHKTRGSASVGGSGSNANVEEAGSTGPRADQDPGVEVTGARIEVISDDPGRVEKRPSKRQRTVGHKPPRGSNIVHEGDELEEEADLGGRVARSSSAPDRVGNYSAAEIVQMMSGIPSKPDWTEMENSGLNNVFQKCAEHWGQVHFPPCFSFHFFLLLLFFPGLGV